MRTSCLINTQKKIDIENIVYYYLGSTAAGFPVDILAKAFSDKFIGKEFEVINAAVGGYNARQEAIVATIWAPQLEPDMIITLDGANDLIHRLRVKQAGTFFLNPAYDLALKKPFLSPFVHIIRHSQAIQGFQRILARNRVDTVDEYVDAVPVYINAQRSINVLARGLSATRVVILQPFKAFKEPLSDAEHSFQHYKYREAVVKELYNLTNDRLLGLAKKDDILYIDGRNVFNGIKYTIFSDDVHFVSHEGYQILAESIVKRINKKKLIKKLIPK